MFEHNPFHNHVGKQCTCQFINWCAQFVLSKTQHVQMTKYQHHDRDAPLKTKSHKLLYKPKTTNPESLVKNGGLNMHDLQMQRIVFRKQSRPFLVLQQLSPREMPPNSGWDLLRKVSVYISLVSLSYFIYIINYKGRPPSLIMLEFHLQVYRQKQSYSSIIRHDFSSERIHSAVYAFPFAAESSVAPTAEQHGGQHRLHHLYSVTSLKMGKLWARDETTSSTITPNSTTSSPTSMTIGRS